MLRRIFSIVLVLCLSLSLFPVTAFAASVDSFSISGLQARYAEGSNILQDLSSVTLTANPAGIDSYEVTPSITVSPSHTTWRPNTTYTAAFTFTIHDGDTIPDDAVVNGLPIGLSPSISSTGNTVTVTFSGFSVYRVVTDISVNGLFNPAEADRHEGKLITAMNAASGSTDYTVTSQKLEKGSTTLNPGSVAASGSYDLVLTLALATGGYYDVFGATGDMTLSFTLDGGAAYNGATPTKTLSSDNKTLTLTFNNFITYSAHDYEYTDNGDYATHKGTCTICGNEITQDHTFGSAWQSDAGYHWHVCTVCGGTNEHQAHVPNNTYTDANQNATQHWHECTICSYVPLDADDHSFTYTSIDENEHTKTCTDCGYSTNEAHNWNDGEVTIAPTASAPGVRTYTCLNCAGTKEEEIPKIVPSGGGGGNASGIGSGGTYSWGERAILNKVGIEFYELLEDNDQPGQMLTDGDTWTLAETDPVPPVQYEINDVYVLQEDEPTYWADETQPAAQPDPLSNPAYYLVDTQNGDKALNFKALKAGDLVRTTTFNGIYITNVTRTGNANYETDIARTKSNIFASYRAFEMDHPEIFWLNGSLKLRILTPTINGKQISYLFLTTADAAGFTMLISNYAAPNAIAEGIARRNTAVETIYATLPKTDTRATLAAINRWLTMHNEYNRTQDLLTIGLIPHQVLCALMGNEGVNGPVCDSYSKAFKMLCDRCKIPCVLVTGTAYANNHSEYHMWNQVQLNGSWYGVDCAWNDPVVRGIYGAVSGYENEKFLLVGASTIIDGMRFDASHVADATPAGVAGIVFSSLDVDLESDYAVPFDDVSIVNWYYEYVRDVLYKGLMSGTAENAFSPKMTATRGQIVQILYNVAGQPTVKEVKVEGWYGKAATWALEKGIVAGYDDEFHGDDPVTREQLATMLYVFAGSPKTSGTLTYADADQVSEYALNALLWAKKLGVISGKPGNLVDPHGLATRAEIAAIFSAFTAE